LALACERCAGDKFATHAESGQQTA